jgi:hypothetical protein
MFEVFVGRGVFVDGEEVTILTVLPMYNYYLLALER